MQINIIKYYRKGGKQPTKVAYQYLRVKTET
jgi:hypothetical protein